MKRRLLFLLAPLAFLALVLYAGPFSGGGGPFPVPFPTNWPGTAGQALLSAGNGITYLGTVAAGGTGAPFTNAIIGYGGDPATAAQTNWFAEANGGWYETNKSGFRVTAKNGAVEIQNGVTNNTGGALPDIRMSGSELGFDNASGYQSAISGSGGALAGLFLKVTNNAGAETIMEGIISTGVGISPVLYATNGVQVLGGSPGILASNTLGAGASYGQITTNAVIWLTNAEAGVSTIIGTNGFLYVSNAIKGAFFQLSSTNLVYSNSIAYLTITNGHIAITNYSAAGQNIDIDPSVAGTTLYGDSTKGDYLAVTLNSVLVSNVNLLLSGQTFASNSIVITAGGTFITGLETNANAIIYSTNTQGNVWTPKVDATLPVQLMTMFTTNLTINGISGLELVHNFNPVTLVTNADSTPHQVVFPAGTRIMQALGTNQPVAASSVTCTNGKTLEIDWLIYPHLGQDVTNAKIWIQTN